MGLDKILIWRAKKHGEQIFIWPARENKILSSLLAAGRASIRARQDFYLARAEKEILSSLLAGRPASAQARILESLSISLRKCSSQPQLGRQALKENLVEPSSQPAPRKEILSSPGPASPAKKNLVELPGRQARPRPRLDKILFWRKILSTRFFARSLDPCDREPFIHCAMQAWKQHESQ